MGVGLTLYSYGHASNTVCRLSAIANPTPRAPHNNDSCSRTKVQVLEREAPLLRGLLDALAWILPFHLFLFEEGRSFCVACEMFSIFKSGRGNSLLPACPGDR